MDYKVWLSIIIPVYNPSYKEFVRCFDSMRGIAVPAEFIFVNDGSEQGIALCMNYTASDNRAIWLSQNNGGVSSARNYGMKYATGKYLLFVDVDDEITREFVHYINTNIRKIENDWVIFDCIDFNLRNGQRKLRSLFGKEVQIVSIEKLLECQINTSNLNECWGKLIQSSFLRKNNIYFQEGRVSGEDVYFNIEILAFASNVLYVPLSSYKYYYEPHLHERILTDPYNYFSYLTTTCHQMKQVLFERLQRENMIRYITQYNASLIKIIGSECLMLMHYDKFDKNMREFILHWINNNRILDGVTARSFTECKGKGYYLSLKFKLWGILRILSLIKYNRFLNRKDFPNG